MIPPFLVLNKNKQNRLNSLYTDSKKTTSILKLHHKSIDVIDCSTNNFKSASRSEEITKTSNNDNSLITKTFLCNIKRYYSAVKI